MNVRTPSDSADRTSKVRRRKLQVIVQTVLIALILFIAAGRLDWGWAWAYLGVGVAVLLVNLRVLSPELIAERGQPRANVKGWDRILTTLVIVPMLGALIVIGLDERYGWSPQLPWPVHAVGLAGIALGQGLFTWAMVANPFFSTAVRIQTERGHRVAAGGPYRYVRHPGYVGYILSWVATALALGSLWALIPVGLVACLMVIRTALEDRTLLEELDGYREYAARVRYRLLPGVW